MLSFFVNYYHQSFDQSVGISPLTRNVLNSFSNSCKRVSLLFSRFTPINPLVPPLYHFSFVLFKFLFYFRKSVVDSLNSHFWLFLSYLLAFEIQVSLHISLHRIFSWLVTFPITDCCSVFIFQFINYFSWSYIPSENFHAFQYFLSYLRSYIRLSILLWISK